MSSLTQSLLSASQDKLAQAADYEKKLASGPASSSDSSADESKSSSTSAPKTAAQKTIESGAKKVGSVIKSGAQKVIGSFKDGGTVPKTGIYKLHEREEIVPAKRASEYRKVYLGRKSKKD